LGSARISAVHYIVAELCVSQVWWRCAVDRKWRLREFNRTSSNYVWHL